MKKKVLTVAKALYSPAGVAFFAAVVASLVISGYFQAHYVIWNFDLAWMTQVVKSYAEFREPTVPMIDENLKALGNHFSPILVLAAPFYALFPHSYTLNVLMALCFGLASAIFANSVKRHIGIKTAYVLGLSLALSWGFFAASSAGFHEYALGAPIFAYALAKFIEKDYWRSALSASFLVFVKEDVGLLLIGLGVVMALRDRHWKWLLLSAWGGFWVYFSIKVFIPALAGGWDFDGMVNVSLETLTTDSPTKLLLILHIVLQGGLIALRSPLAYVLAPFLAARLFTEWTPFYTIGYHYDMLTMILAAFALLDALQRHRWSPLMKIAALTLPLIVSLFVLLNGTWGEGNGALTRNYSEDTAKAASYEKLFETIPKDAVILSSNESIAAFMDRGYETYFIRASSRIPLGDCLVNHSDTILDSDLKVAATIKDYEGFIGKPLEQVFSTEEVSAWCTEDFLAKTKD